MLVMWFWSQAKSKGFWRTRLWKSILIVYFTSLIHTATIKLYCADHVWCNKITSNKTSLFHASFYPNHQWQATKYFVALCSREYLRGKKVQKRPKIHLVVPFWISLSVTAGKWLTFCCIVPLWHSRQKTHTHSCVSSPCASFSFPLSVWPPLPLGLVYTCGSSRPPRQQTCSARRSWRSAGRRWSTEASRDYDSLWATKREERRTEKSFRYKEMTSIKEVQL